MRSLLLAYDERQLIEAIVVRVLSRRLERHVSALDEAILVARVSSGRALLQCLGLAAVCIKNIELLVDLWTCLRFGAGLVDKFILDRGGHRQAAELFGRRGQSEVRLWRNLMLLRSGVVGARVLTVRRSQKFLRPKLISDARAGALDVVKIRISESGRRVWIMIAQVHNF